MSKKKTKLIDRLCDECSRFMTHSYRWPCASGHRPLFRQQKDALDRNWGYHRRCEDFLKL
jgi:hypothetical protein